VRIFRPCFSVFEAPAAPCLVAKSSVHSLHPHTTYGQLTTDSTYGLAPLCVLIFKAPDVTLPAVRFCSERLSPVFFLSNPARYRKHVPPALGNFGAFSVKPGSTFISSLVVVYSRSQFDYPPGIRSCPSLPFDSVSLFPPKTRLFPFYSLFPLSSFLRRLVLRL